MHLVEMQDTASQIADAEKAVVDAKEALTQVVVADLAQGEDQRDVPMYFEELLEQLVVSKSRLPASKDPKAQLQIARHDSM